MGAFLTGLAVAAVTWWFAPAITFLLNKLLSYLYDASQDFRQMRSGTVPRLKFTLGEVVEQRMLIELSKKKSDMTKLSDLDTLLKKLRDALYEAEGILDLVDYHQIEKEAGKAESSTWLQWCCQRLRDSTRQKTALLLQSAKQRVRCLRRIPRLVFPSSCGLPVVLPPLSLLQRISLCCRSFGSKISLCCRSFGCCSFIFNLLTKAIEGAGYYRDWSFIELGFTRYQEGVVRESNCTIFGPLYVLLKENMKKVQQLTDEAQEIITLKKKVQETIRQANQPRRNNSGTSTAKVTTGDRQKTTAYPVGKVTGRDNVCQQIRTMLHASTADVVGIYGIAGSGKTTLAQYICNAVKEDEEEKKREEKECHFHLFMWIDVTQKFSVHGIFSEMLEAVSGQKAEYNSLGVLQTKLKNELNRIFFLLVLDDIWCNMDAGEQNLQWLIFPLQFGMKGSKILATSRNKGAFAALGPEVTYTSIPYHT